MKFAFSLSFKVKILLAAVLLTSTFGFYTFQALYPSISMELNLSASTVTRLALIPIVAGFATLLVPAFIENRRRRLLAAIGLLVAFPASALMRWFGNALFVTEGFEELGLFLIRYMFFTPTYALIFAIGWAVFRLAERRGEMDRVDESFPRRQRNQNPTMP